MSKAVDLNQTSQYIRLFQLQLNGVLEDLVKPAELLSGQFSDSLLNLYSIREHLVDDNELNREEISVMVEELIGQMFQCVSSMQFVDAKRQRIEHVAHGLDCLIDMHSRKNAIVSDWDDFKNKIQKQYKMDKERNIYNKYLEEFNIEDDFEYSDVAE
jgi:hypothetical protein